jgi:hypothetical protein
MHVALPELKGRSLQETIAVPSFLKVTVPFGTPAGDVTAAEKVKLCSWPPDEESPVVVDALAIWNERATSVAGSWFESPPCEAVIDTLARAVDVHARSRGTALAQRRETHRQTGRGRGAHDEVSVAEGLVREGVESDRLRGCLRRNCLSHLWCGVVVGVAGLVVLHRAVAGGYGEGRTVVRAGPELLYETGGPEDDVAATLNWVLCALAGRAS